MKANLVDYLLQNAIVIYPQSGMPDPDRSAYVGDWQDVIFFKVAAKPSAKDTEVRELIAQHKGEFCDVDPLDGRNHDFLELGGWIGDQGAALTLMGLGAALALWELLTPKSILGEFVDDHTAMQMSGMGMIAIKAKT